MAYLSKNISLAFIFATFWGNAVMANPLDSVQSFGYQLQDINKDEIEHSALDLFIIDYSKDGSDKSKFTKTEVQTMKSSGDTSKFLVAYLSIGEAEEYRYYFRRKWVQKIASRTCGRKKNSEAPSWLDDPNINWCGNYKVRYWNKEWQEKIFGIRNGPAKSYLDRIIDAGFDGVYLDIIDGYEYWKYEKLPSKSRRRSAATDMAQFVIDLSNYARKVRQKKHFIVIPQNGAGILGELSDSLKRKYLNAINGIGSEDAFYFGEGEEDNEFNPQRETISNLEEFKNNGKKVLTIEYLTDISKIENFKAQACQKGFIPQVGRRELQSFSAQVLNGC